MPDGSADADSVVCGVAVGEALIVPREIVTLLVWLSDADDVRVADAESVDESDCVSESEEDVDDDALCDSESVLEAVPEGVELGDELSVPDHSIDAEDVGGGVTVSDKLSVPPERVLVAVGLDVPEVERDDDCDKVSDEECVGVDEIVPESVADLDSELEKVTDGVADKDCDWVWESLLEAVSVSEAVPLVRVREVEVEADSVSEHVGVRLTDRVLVNETVPDAERLRVADGVMVALPLKLDDHELDISIVWLLVIVSLLVGLGLSESVADRETVSERVCVIESLAVIDIDDDCVGEVLSELVCETVVVVDHEVLDDSVIVAVRDGVDDLDSDRDWDDV